MGNKVMVIYNPNSPKENAEILAMLHEEANFEVYTDSNKMVIDEGDIPLNSPRPGFAIELRIDVTTGRVFAIEVPKLLTTEEKVEELIQKSMSPSENYKEVVEKEVDLDTLKNARILKLKEECSTAIYEGFTSVDNEFGFNETDQVNFTQRMLTIVAGATGPFEWKSKNNGVVELTKAQFTKVIQDAEAHKLNEQKKYWELEQQVLAAETNEAVDAVKW